MIRGMSIQCQMLIKTMILHFSFTKLRDELFRAKLIFISASKSTITDVKCASVQNSKGSNKWQNTSELLPCHVPEVLVEQETHTSTYPAARRFLFDKFAVLTTGVPKCSGFVSGSSSKV